VSLEGSTRFEKEELETGEGARECAQRERVAFEAGMMVDGHW